MAQDDYIRTALRVPPELHKALHEAAAATGKSFNAEIIGRLAASFKHSAVDLNQIEIAGRLYRMELLQRRDALVARITALRQRLEFLWMQRLVIQKEGASPAELANAANQGEQVKWDINNSTVELNRIDRELAEIDGVEPPSLPPEI